jgi:hypothetical protein
MADLVGAFVTPHFPQAPGLAEREGPRSALASLFSAVRAEVEAVNPDVLVMFDTDHFATWFYDKLPTFSVGVADRTSGPGNDEWPGLPSYELAVHGALARHVHRAGIQASFDLTLSEEFGVDHSIIVPLHFLNTGMRRSIVPIWINGMAPPLPLAQRCFALGLMVRDAIKAWPEGLRVGLLASCSVSGEIGGPHALPGEPFAAADEAWVTHVTGRIMNDEVSLLLHEATEERMLEVGNVTGEMLNLIALLGALDSHRPRFLEPLYAFGGNVFGAWRWDR